MEPLGPKIRRQRRRLGLTLDELAGRTGISKPYLSLIETGRVPNPPSDEKLRRIEQSLGFSNTELVSQAHLLRTPRDVRVMLSKLMQGQAARGKGQEKTNTAMAMIEEDSSSPLAAGHLPLNLDDAYMSGVLHELVERTAGNVETVMTNAVPVINRVSAGYPSDFTDLSYPRGVADDYVSCPDVQDVDAFACRVHGDSMSPKYREGDIVIFSPAAAPKSGTDCFVRFEDGQTTFKRIFFESDDSGAPILRLQPRNEKYRPQVVPTTKINGLYRAVYRYQPVGEDS
jgi:repressor LexA